MTGKNTKLSLCREHECIFVTDECPACQEADSAIIQRDDYERSIDGLRAEVETLNTKLADLKSRL